MEFIVVHKHNPQAILCTDGEFHGRSMVGPGGWCAKVYKTRAMAEKHNPYDRVVNVEGYFINAKDASHA